MKIDCRAEKIIIGQDSVQNLNKYSLGSQNFTNSIKTVGVYHYFRDLKSDIFEDLVILHKYFSNLECVNLNTKTDLTLTQISQICKNWKINDF